MLKWFSNDESSQAPGAPAPREASGSQSLAEVTEQLAQTEQLAAQLKELIREKDSALRTKDEQLKAEKDACEAKLSKMKLQNRAKVTSLNSQLDELKKRQSLSGKEAKSESRKAGGDGDSEHSSASRGKILLLKKKVEELEQQLSQREAELKVKTNELEVQRQRGGEMDAMLVEKDKKLAEKEAYIVDLQMSTAGVDAAARASELSKSAEEQKTQSAKQDSSLQDLQMLVQNLTKKVGDGEEKYSLLQEQTESLKELLVKEKEQFEEKENMYKQNIQTFKDIILQKDNRLTEINQMHDQELFKLAAKLDASADLEQLLKALKQKLHEKEEVLLGKTQVIDVLQQEVDGRDQQIKDLLEKMRRLQGEKDNMQSKLDAEKHVMRAQLRDLMQKQETELRKAAEKHQTELAEKEQELHRQVEALRRSQPTLKEGEETLKVTPTPAPADMATAQKILELEAQTKLKAEEASKSEAKFLKMKAWSKSHIKQLEDELRKAQSGKTSPDANALWSKITDLEEEREEMLCKLEQYDELKVKNEQLIAKLVGYEEQHRKMQADLEQVAKRAASQTSESGSADDLQSQVLEWQEMVVEAESARDQAREEKAALALRMSHIEEEREALASRQQELEEELAQAQGLRQQRGKKLGDSANQSLQEDFEFDGKQPYQDPKCTLESTTTMDGENMGGLRSVVEELELERNQLQEQILGLEERCQDLEDRLQLQARIESLQNETERLQGQLAGLRSQQNRDTEKHQMLVTSLNEQLKGLSEAQECLETSLIEKEHTIAKTSEKLELIDSLRDSLKEKEVQHRELSEKLLQTEHSLTEVTKKCNTFEKQCSELKTSVTELTQKFSTLKEKTNKQEATIESLQSDLEQTNDELDKLNSTHLEERAQLIHDLQSCEREIDNLKDILIDKETEISALSNNMSEYAEQIVELKREIKDKEEALVLIDTALTRAEQKAQILKDSQSSDQQALNTKITDLLDQLKSTECELSEAKEQKELKRKEIEVLVKQTQEDNQTIQSLRGEIQKLNVNHHSHLTECESQISSLKEQMTVSSQRLQESEALLVQMKESNATSEKLQDQLQDKEQLYEKELKSFKEERNKLLAEVNKHNKELQDLSKQLEEQVVGKEQVKKEVEEKLETIALLEQKLTVTQQEAEGERLKLNQELIARDSVNKKLQNELQEESEKLRQEVAVGKRSLSELMEENSTMQSRISSFEIQRSENCKVIDGLLKEKEELTEQSTALKSGLLEKDSTLQQVTSKCTSLENEFVQQKQVLTRLQSESESLRKSNKLREHVAQMENEIVDLKIRIQGQLQTMLEKNNQLTMSITEKESELQEKVNDCDQLRAQLSELEDSALQLRNQVRALTSESTQLKGMVKEKEQTVLESQTSFLSHCEDWKVQSKAKEEECNGLKARLAERQETISKLEVDLFSRSSEIVKFREALEDKELGISAQTKAFLGKSDEAALFKAQFMESTELVSQLQDQIQELSKTQEEKQSAFLNLQDKYAAHLEELHDVKMQLSQRNDEISNLNKALGDRSDAVQAAGDTADALRNESALLQDKLQRIQASNAKLSKQKEDALAAHQTNAASLTVEIESLKSQHLQVASQMNALTENIEQRELALHAINNQYSAQVKHAEYLVTEMQKLDEQNKKLREESSLAAQHFQQQLGLSISEKEHWQQEAKKVMNEKEELVRNYNSQLQILQGQLSLKSQQHLSSMNEAVEKMKTEKELLQVQEELENVQETSDKVKNENEYLETFLLKNSEKIDELTEALSVMQGQNAQLSTHLTESKEEKVRFSQAKEEQQLKLVKEFEEKLKVMQRGNEGSKNIKKELQELLKEKHQEINQFQHDCIKYQELILDLEKSLKLSESEREQVEGNLKGMNEKISGFENGLRHLEAELSSYKNQLSESSKELESINSENNRLREEISGKDKQAEIKMVEQEKALERVAEQQMTLYKGKLAEFQNQINELQALKSSFAQVKGKLLDTESQLLLMLSQNDKLQVDLEKQEAISVQLKSLLQNKDSEISLLLSSKDGQISEYLEQLQKHHRAQIENYEERLSALYSDKEMADKAFRGLESKVRALQVKIERSVEEKEQMAKKLETFKKSMTSLQTERDRLLSEYRALEAHRQSAMRDEGGLAKEELGASQGLKKEIKALLHQMDDLNSENAMLKAQLIRYREDLNQVLSLKDNQLKELLRKQEDSIKNLENQKAAIDGQCRQFQLDLQKKVEDNIILKSQNSKLGTQVEVLEASIFALRKEKSETNESKVIADLQQAVAAKAAECNDLQQKLLAQKMAADDMKKNMQELESETERKLGEAEDKFNSELNAFEREVDLMRNEKETADERVAELARDLMQTEQMLSSARNEGKDLKSQHESLGKAMAALQNDRDQLIEDFKVLRNRYDEELRETKSATRKLEHQLGEANSELSSLTKDRYILTQKLSALQGADAHSQLLRQIDELCRTISEKDTELRRFSLENDTYGKQLTAFSRSMASLQNDRDRLMQELAGAKRVCEARQGVSPAEAAPGSSEELSSFRSNFHALQTEKDRLLEDIGKLRSENATEMTQKKLKCKQHTEKDVNKYEAELTKLRAEKDQLQSECRVLREQQSLAVGGVQRRSSEAQLKQATGPQALLPPKESVAPLGKDVPPEQFTVLMAERAQLQRDLQRCLQEIQQRDLRFQQINTKLHQTVEEKVGVSSQLKAVSQTLRDTQLSLGQLQHRCYWLEGQVQSPHRQDQAEGLVAVEVPPGAPQERSNVMVDMEGLDTRELQSRLAEAEQQLDSSHQEVAQLTESLAEERVRREAAEEAMNLAEERARSIHTSISDPREFSIQLESDDEVRALIIDPNEHVVMRKVKGGVHSCRRWVRGRSLYCSKLLTSRAKSRYLFLTYLLALHVVVFMCLTGGL
ncbi:hypothetical protein SKAU_G00315320 [Synaphobranchus kaupii]|uniref:Golgin subfamily B member 1-like n=1 Tax=Synaphobranchus kaupii TaxID=118154 RepID=A0A9Q1ILG7_SYNKA|nr:hypothetical protein SKAU_G00315320 [Synaphobranchus kaupii]